MHYALDDANPKELREQVCQIFLDYFALKFVGSRRVSFWLSNGGPDASWVRAIETFEDLALDVPTYLIFKMIDAFAAEDPLNDHVWFGETDETDEAFSLALDRFRQLVVRFAPRRGLALPNLDEWPEMPRLEGSLSDDPAHIGLRAQIERDAALLKKHSLASVSPNTSTGSSDSASLDPPLT